jgi:hypothetical protein
MNSDGILFVARNGSLHSARIIIPQRRLTSLPPSVPSASGGINIALNNVPAGDKWFFLFINSTHGGLYANSQSFSIVNTATSNNSTGQQLASKPTLTVSGGPNPTAQFATTFPATNGVYAWRPTPTALLSACLMAFALLAGAAAVL